MATESASISQKLEALIALTEQWDAALKAAAETNIEAIEGSEAATKSLIATTEKAMISAQKLIDKTVEAGRAAETTAAQVKKAATQFTPTSGAATNYFPWQQYQQGSSTGYELNQVDKARFLRISLDQDKAALDAKEKEYQEQIKKLYENTGYEKLKATLDKLKEENKAIEDEMVKTREAMKGKEGTQVYSDLIDKYEKLDAQGFQIVQEQNKYEKVINQYARQEKQIQENIDLLKRMFSEEGTRQRLASEKESAGYSKDDLLFLFNQAIKAENIDPYKDVRLLELLGKITSAIPEKRYQLDLTVGDQKLSAFTEMSPEQFLDALLKARGTAI